MTHARLTDELVQTPDDGAWTEDASRGAAFEAAVAARHGARHAIATASPMVAFLAAYRAAGAAPGATVLTSSLADPTVARAAVATGYRLRFADVDTRGHLTAEDVARHTALHGVPRILVPTHYAGSPCDVERLADAAPGALVIEDAVDALGVIAADGRPVGAPAHAAMTVVGFHPLKASTPAQVAVVLTDDDALAARCRRFRDERPEHRLSELHAALALVELGRLAAIVDGRGHAALRHAEALVALPLATEVAPSDGTRSAWSSYLVRIPAWARSATVDALGRHGVTGRRVQLLLHRHPFFGRSDATLPAELPGTERFAAETLILSTVRDDESPRLRGDHTALRPTASVLDTPRVALAG